MSRLCVGCSFVVLLLFAVPLRAADQTVLPIEQPPEALARMLADLASDEANIWVAAKTKLSEMETAEPYLRHMVAVGKPKVAERAAEVLAKLYQPISKRNAERAKRWIRDGRIDLVIDAGVLPKDVLQADAFGQLVVPFGHAIVGEADRITGRATKGTRFFYESMDAFTKQRDMQWQYGKEETTGLALNRNVFMRAQSCTAKAPERHYWLTMTRTDLVGAYPTSNQWSNSLILHNNRIVLDSCHNSLVVCDGDVEIENNGQFDMSVVIARGTIRANVPVVLNGQCVLFATGEIALAKPSHLNATLIAGGVVTAKQNPNSPAPKIEQKVGTPPFPVRFFETADVGVETALKGESLTITKLTVGSPLAKYGIREGDAVTRVNEKDIKTANDFRRELRYSVSLEAGFFHITRGGEKLTRVVYFKNGLEK